MQKRKKAKTMRGENKCQGVEYYRPCDIYKRFPLSRTTVWRLLNEFRTLPEYEGAYITVSPRIKLIRAAAFEQFLSNRERMRLKK
jgi:hypothetical protein